ncbi:unnamed protein product [Meganyctiphanes norvegica]|uniref:Uncharacterized protein n=1 Tax=Meganyctiphanes norvegica TaxID=48144 RepID=A0AAV2SQL4_MEGNR
MVFPLCVSSHDQKDDLSLRKPCYNSNINMVFPQCVSSNVSYEYYSVKNPCPSGCMCTVFSRMYFLDILFIIRIRESLVTMAIFTWLHPSLCLYLKSLFTTAAL